ncbi:hypothetical protein Pcinc_037247 [Petrolisthes cinctipes]|uniref:Uncharacterized protein n=1 Tax=Petrolisthes cinctipes TaxID=88211 RepID=A0AAE1BUF1_PETCI|nr:hypothetical protein Pcinc_037247 [Petrolisthes cinctipes]
MASSSSDAESPPTDGDDVTTVGPSDWGSGAARRGHKTVSTSPLLHHPTVHISSPSSNPIITQHIAPLWSVGDLVKAEAARSKTGRNRRARGKGEKEGMDTDSD